MAPGRDPRFAPDGPAGPARAGTTWGKPHGKWWRDPCYSSYVWFGSCFRFTHCGLYWANRYCDSYWPGWYNRCGLYRYWPFCYYSGYWPYYGSWPWYGWSFWWLSTPGYASQASYDYDPACPYSVDEAWAMLTARDASGAYGAFRCLADDLPDRGLPLLGRSLSAALLGREDEAVAAMRDVLQVEPDALDQVPESASLREQTAYLAEQFEARARRQYADVDALFMAASLRYLLGDVAAAHYSIDVAINLGDESASSAVLRSFIEDLIQR